MANHMETYVEVRDLKKEGLEFLNNLFQPIENTYGVDSLEIAQRFHNIEDSDLITREFMINKFGAKWLTIYADPMELDHTHFTITSAWSVPIQFLEDLANRINQIQNTKDATLVGTYLDESYDPCGAFVFGYDYDDIEDVYGSDDGLIEFDYEKFKDSEDSEYLESVEENLEQEKESMYISYCAYLREITEEKL